MKKLLVIGFTTFMLCATSITVMAAGCGDWDTVSIGSAFCDSNDGCGFLWQKATNKAVITLKRNCVDNANVYSTEYSLKTTTLGCCQ